MDSFSGTTEPHKKHGTPAKDVFPESFKTATPASRKWTILRTTAVGAFILLVVCGVILTTLLTRTEKQSSGRLVEVTLEPGETLLYQIEQVLEVQSGELQKGTISAIVALQVKNKTSEEYWFILKIINITATGDNLDKIGDVNQGITKYFLVRLERTSRRGREEWSYSSKADQSFEIYGYRKTDPELTRYVRAILTQLLPTVERDLYELVDGEKPDPYSEPKPERSSLLPGTVKMHRQAKTSENDAILIKNNFNLSDVANMSSDIDLDMSYADSAIVNKSNGMVTKSQVDLTEKLNFGEPIQLKNGSFASMMNVTFASNVTLLNDEKFRMSYLEDEELAEFNIRGFVKLDVPKADVNFTMKGQSEREAKRPSASPSASNATFADLDDRATNLTADSNVSRHRTRRSLTSTQSRTAALFEKKVLGINAKVDMELRIDSSTTEYTLVSKLGSRSKTLFRVSINAFKPISKTISLTESVKFDFSVPVFVISLGVEFKLWITATIEVVSGSNTLSPLKLDLTVTPSVAIEASLHGYVSAHVIRAGVSGDGDFIRGSLPFSVSYDEHRSSNKKGRLVASVDCNILDLEAGIFYQWRKCHWVWPFGIKCDWGTRHNLHRFGRWSAFRLRHDLLDVWF